MVASSEQQRAPVIVNNPATAHARSNQPGAPLSRNRVLLNVMPFLSVILTRSKVPIKIFRLSDGRFDRECCCNPSRTYALPHLHPVRYAPCADFRPRKEMHMIGHDNIIAHPPAVMIGRALPDIMENLLAARRSKNFASLISARCKKDNRVVAERRYICQMAKWSWPALGPHKRSSVRGRAVSMIALVHHNNEPRGALILTLSRSRRDRNLRANSTAPGVSP